MERITGITLDMQTHVILYGAYNGEQGFSLNKQKAYNAIVKNGYYPAESDPIELGLKNSAINDDEDGYWMIGKNNLDKLFDQKVRYRLKDGLINHLSIFGFTPQPLLIYLGYILSDIPTAEIYQLHRFPPVWGWFDSSVKANYKLIKKEKKGKDVALVFSLSQKVDPGKITGFICDRNWSD